MLSLRLSLFKAQVNCWNRDDANLCKILIVSRLLASVQLLFGAVTALVVLSLTVQYSVRLMSLHCYCLGTLYCTLYCCLQRPHKTHIVWGYIAQLSKDPRTRSTNRIANEFRTCIALVYCLQLAALSFSLFTDGYFCNDPSPRPLL